MVRRRIDASHVIAFQHGGHRYLRDGVGVIDGSEIIHVGPQESWNQAVDESIDARGMVVTPGFINTHTHLYESPLDKSFVEDMGRRQFYLSGLFEYLPVRSMAMDDEAAHACLAYSMVELLRTGTTTVMEIGAYGEEAVRQAGRVGMRLYMGLGYRSGHWYTHDGKAVKYASDEEGGLRAMAPGSWTNWAGDDVGILAETGTNVAHAVWVFARRGIAMESFARYLARGVNMTLGTDTSPQSMIEALRYTAVVGKIVDRQTEVATAADVFNAATLSGAKALGRDDLGRIAPGAKADLLIWR